MTQVIETGGPEMHFVDATLTTGELLALFTTPKSLVVAQGANTVVEFVSALLAYDYNATVYTVGTAGDLQVKYTDGSGAAASSTRACTGFIDQASDQLSMLEKVGGTVVPVANAALVLTLATANPTLGDSPINIRVAYRVHLTGL
jgi:hypothetical protein